MIDVNGLRERAQAVAAAVRQESVTAEAVGTLLHDLAVGLGAVESAIVDYSQGVADVKSDLAVARASLEESIEGARLRYGELVPQLESLKSRVDEHVHALKGLERAQHEASMQHMSSEGQLLSKIDALSGQMGAFVLAVEAHENEQDAKLEGMANDKADKVSMSAAVARVDERVRGVEGLCGPRLFVNVNALLDRSEAMSFDVVLELLSGSEHAERLLCDGVVLTYLSGDGWRAMQWEASRGAWGDSSAWVPWGAEHKVELDRRIGELNEHVVSLAPHVLVNVNSLLQRESAFETFEGVLSAVAAHGDSRFVLRDGVVLTYLSGDGWRAMQWEASRGAWGDSGAWVPWGNYLTGMIQGRVDDLLGRMVSAEGALRRIDVSKADKGAVDVLAAADAAVVALRPHMDIDSYPSAATDADSGVVQLARAFMRYRTALNSRLGINPETDVLELNPDYITGESDEEYKNTNLLPRFIGLDERFQAVETSFGIQITALTRSHKDFVELRYRLPNGKLLHSGTLPRKLEVNGVQVDTYLLKKFTTLLGHVAELRGVINAIIEDTGSRVTKLKDGAVTLD